MRCLWCGTCCEQQMLHSVLLVNATDSVIPLKFLLAKANDKRWRVGEIRGQLVYKLEKPEGYGWHMGTVKYFYSSKHH